jgi:hypothetical protein
MQQYLTTFVPFLFITNYLGKLNIYGEMLDRLYVDNSTPLKPVDPSLIGGVNHKKSLE